MTKARDYVLISSDPAFAVSGELRVLAWNHAAERLFGRSAADAVGRCCCDVLSAELPTGEPLCGPDCHGGVCFCGGVPFSVDDCLVPRADREPVHARISSLIVPRDGDTGAARTRALIFIHPRDEAGGEAGMPQPLHIRMLGRFSVTVNERPVEVATWPRKAAVRTLKILAMQPGHLVSRDRLIEYLWPDVDERRGRERVKVAIHSLRQLLGCAGLVEHVDHAYALPSGAVLLDVAVFERLVAEGIRHARRGRKEEAAGRLGDALRLYRGDYLEDDIYEEWCAEERMRLREMYFEAAELMAVILMELRRHDEAGQVCLDALARESCREAFHRMRMECLLAEGRVEDAEWQYRLCREALSRDLGVDPLPETRRIAARIHSERV